MKSFLSTLFGGRSRPIPAKIHQLWIPPSGQPPSIPADILRQAEMWPRLHPGYEHRIWTLNDIMRVIPSADADTLEQLSSICRFNAMKADLARLFLLHHVGGFWIDLKIVPRRAFLEELASHDLVVAEPQISPFIPNPSGMLCNGFFGCKPGNAFIAQCKGIVIGNVSARVSSTVWAVSGPYVFITVKNRLKAQSPSAFSGRILTSAEGWDGFFAKGSDSYNGGGQHWSEREQSESMYLDREDRADPVPIWRHAFQA